ncbi:MAG: hypothetical protein CVU84_13300 [Firmicutes bacterium HGW-Firmicutes-1]|jgi:uncharacterized protein (UPF0303 family)|nr:MAG: hypothetical protein CVU84_13300 [Firmicutes bacterium HGW-Firmicutes-1]
MSQYSSLLDELIEQEKELQFKKFNSETAFTLGILLVEKAKEGNKNVAIDITFNGHQLFHYAFEGTSPDNGEWIKRKSRVVNRFHTSSYRMGIKLKIDNVSIEDKYFVNPMEYAPHGGSFPIIIKEVGYVGTITVSGLPQEEDHQMVVEAIREYLENLES